MNYHDENTLSPPKVEGKPGYIRMHDNIVQLSIIREELENFMRRINGESIPEEMEKLIAIPSLVVLMKDGPEAIEKECYQIRDMIGQLNEIFFE